ncbi:MAG: hypothetical protein WCS54_00150 [Fibrobacteraceae bacterium]
MKPFRVFSFLILAFAVACAVSCSQEYEPDTNSLDRVTQNRSTFALMDSLILTDDADSLRGHTHSYESYTPATSELTAAMDSLDSSSFVRLSVSRRWTADEPLSFMLTFNICKHDEINDYYGCRYEKVFYLDLYGCADKYCLTTRKIIFRDEDYAHAEVLLPDSDFVIKKRSDSKFEYGDYGKDCVVTEEHLFNLKLHTSRVRADWDIQLGSETCQEQIPNAMFAEASL